MSNPVPRALGRTLRALSASLLGAAALSGCSYLPWLGGEKDPRPLPSWSPSPPRSGSRPCGPPRSAAVPASASLALVPALYGDRLFIADTDGTVAAVGSADGRVQWQRKTEFAFSAGPDSDGRQLVLGTSNGLVVALSPADGSQLWSASVESEVLAVPRINGDLVVVHTLDDSVYGLEAATGKQRWRFPYPAPILTLRGNSSPVFADGAALVGLSGGKLVKLDLANGVSGLGGHRDPAQRPYRVGAHRRHRRRPGGRRLHHLCGDLQRRPCRGGPGQRGHSLAAHPVLPCRPAADTRDIFVTDSETTFGPLNPSDGAGRWKQEQLTHRLLTAPVLVGDYLVVGDLEGYLHWISRRDGRSGRALKVAGGAITARPVVSGGGSLSTPMTAPLRP